MTLSTGTLSSALTAVGTGDLLSVLVRVTLIAATGILLGLLLRRTSAATRYLTAMATLIVLMAFPAAKVFLPAVALPILPAARHSAAPPADAVPNVQFTGPSSAFVPEASAGNAEEGVRSSALRSTASLLPVYAILLFLLVSSVLFLRVLVSFAAASITARRARRIDDDGLRQELASACERLGVARAVDLRESASVAVPVVWGLFRPVLLLPIEARTWRREQLRVVFLHEVAHVARYDAVGLLLTRIATSVFWFHPLVWKLASDARRECERCCDDLVLAAGERATDYAAHLLAIVRSMTGRDRLAEVAPALAQRSNLEGRLVSILRAGQSRDSVSRARLAATVGLAGLLLVATTAIRVVAAPARASEAVDRSALAQDDDSQGGVVLLASRDALNALEAANRFGRKEPATSISTSGDPCPNTGDDEVTPPEINTEVEEQTEVQELTDVQQQIEVRTQTDVIAAAAAAAVASVAPPPTVYWVNGSKYKNKKSELNQSGIELMRAGQYARAITAFEQEIRESGSSNAMYNLACAYSLRGDKSRAFSTLQTAIENGFDNSRHMTEDEDLKLLQGDPHFYQLVRLAQDLQLFSGGRFGGMNDESDWRRAVPRFERVAKDHPDIGRAWANLGFARLEAGDAKGGALAYQKALDLGYQKPTTLYNLACCASRSGDLDGAFRWLDRSDKAGFEIGEHVGSDTDLDALRGDPRYGAMLERWDQKMAKEHREKQRDEEKLKTD